MTTIVAKGMDEILSSYRKSQSAKDDKEE